MWALGFLVAVLAYFMIVNLTAKAMSVAAGRTLWAIAVALPLSFPFWHYLYPSYQEFQRLCASDNRYVVSKVAEVDFVYSESCYQGFLLSKEKAFKGYECMASRNELPDGYPEARTLFRFARNEVSNSPACVADCAPSSEFIWEKKCHKSCYSGVPIAAAEFPFAFSGSNVVLQDGRLRKIQKSMVGPANETLVTALDYVYYPYGHGFAKIFGMASGEAPTKSCTKVFNISLHDFLKPRSNP
jgi:hypothetical protein